MRRSILSIVCLVVVAVLLAPGGSPRALAQDSASGDPVSAGGEVFDLKFDGGTVKDYAAAVRRANARANIVVLAEAGRVPVPAVELKSVDVAAAMTLLDRHEATIDGQRWMLSLRHTDGESVQSVPVFTLAALAAGGRASNPESQEMQASVLSIARILQPGNLKSDDALTAVETALALFADGPTKPEIRFHAETGLLIARGTSEQIGVIHQVVGQLQNTAETLEIFQNRQRNALGEDERKELLARVEGAQHCEQAARNEVVIVQTRNQVLQDELSSGRRELGERDALLREMATRVHMLELELSKRSE